MFTDVCLLKIELLPRLSYSGSLPIIIKILIFLNLVAKLGKFQVKGNYARVTVWFRFWRSL